jgi:hypothetical protein
LAIIAQVLKEEIMKNINSIVLSVVCITSTTLSAIAQVTNNPPPPKKGLGHDAKVVGSDMKKGTEGVFKDIGKGAKKVGGGLEKGTKDVVKGTEKGAQTVGSDTKKGFSKLTGHKKTAGTSSAPTTSQ